MLILPLKLLTKEDQLIYGVESCSLGLLKRMGVNVPAGVVVTPPEMVVRTVLKHYQTKGVEVFEQSWSIIKKEVLKTPIPVELDQGLAKQKSFLNNQTLLIGKQKLWQQLLLGWLDQIKVKLYQAGFNPDLTKQLDPQIILFCKGQGQLVKAQFDPEFKESTIESLTKGGQLKTAQIEQINQIVKEANNRLVMPNVYTFLVNRSVELIDLTPYTQPVPASVQAQITLPAPEEKRVIKSTVKVFANLSTGFVKLDNLNGVLIEDRYDMNIDNSVFKLADACLSYPQDPVIYKLPDDKLDLERGCLRLISHTSLFNQAVTVIDLIKNKKSFNNFNLAIPYVRSSNEYLQIKRELSAKGINRKGSLRYWVEFSVPENFINLDSYLLAGLDGVLIDLDQLAESVGGYNLQVGQFYKAEVMGLVKFLAPYIKELHKERIPVLVKGVSILHSVILDFLLEIGIFGLVANNLIEAESMPEHLNWAEKRFIHKRLLS